ncbi:MAG: sigma 54-interacting transcriptional regulator [Acidobacteria bacterium]|nr:sigma 54-interacting transcriptional regulator [Acidobacteriota bacterium]
MLNRLARIIVDSISDGVFTVDKQFIVTYFNKAAERITGFRAQEAIGKHCFEIFRTEVCHSRCAIRDTLSSHEAVDDVRVTIITQDGREVPISLSTEVLRDERGEFVGVAEFFRDLTEVEHAREALEQEKVLGTIVSGSPVVRRVIQMLPNIAESECNVTIHGPSGSGKELFAEAIHKLSPRRYGPYIKLNCAALPATLLESELFGYMKGAFTDARRDKPGLFALANGGTLLLDEISEMDVSLQVKLLRVLAGGEYQPLGATRTLKTDARVIAATNADLKRAITEGRFREDLYFRINVVAVELPPLRERPEDIPLLVDHFIEKVRAKIRKPVTQATPRTLSLLQRYSFPGNVRELQNAIEHAFVMCDGEELKPEHLPEHITAETALSTRPLDGDTERQLIEETLRRHGGNRSAAASELRMHRTTLWRKLRAYQVGVQT